MRKKLILSVLFFITYPLVIFAYNFSIPHNQYDFSLIQNQYVFDNITFLPVDELKITNLTAIQNAKLQAFKRILPSSVSMAYNLKAYQTPVKNQNPRGSCQAFAYIGALEAAYVRKYGLNAANKDTDGWYKYSKYFITNDCSLVCVTQECMKNCKEFDLSEEYHIHLAFTTDSNCNPNLNYENKSSYLRYGFEVCNGSNDMPGEEMSTNDDAYALPLEKYAPYFGEENAHLNSYGINHSYDALALLAKQSGMKMADDKVDRDYYKQHPEALTQKMIDDFEYDNRHIPLDARKHAIYGHTSLITLTGDDARDTDFLEKTIFNNNEVEIGVDLAKLDCGFNNNNISYSDGTAVSKYKDGYTICKYPVTPQVFQQCVQACKGSAGCLSGCGGGLHEKYDNSGQLRGSGHAMLLVGYDKTAQLFLLKNSWGNAWPYIWVPYQFIKKQANGGFIIKDIRDPNLGPSKKAMWLGKWNMDFDGHLGSLYIRRTKFRAQDDTKNTRIGTFYGEDGVPHMVTGNLPFANPDMINLHIDFSNPEPAPFDYGGLNVSLTGQEFDLSIFYNSNNKYTFGNFAAGKTSWAGADYGTLLNRENISIEHHKTTGFSINKWKDSFRLFYNQGGEAHLEVIDIGKANGSYYPVESIFNQKKGNYSAIDQNHTNHMFSFGAFQDIYYHTWETGIVSGIGIFGLPAIPAPKKSGYFTYTAVSEPVLSSDPSKAKPFAISHSVIVDSIGFKIGTLAFSEPVDIYVAIYAPQINNDYWLFAPDLSLHPVSSGAVKWKENWTDPIDEQLFSYIFLENIPKTQYTLYVFIAPTGKLSPNYIWKTEFSNPWGTTYFQPGILK